MSLQYPERSSDRVILCRFDKSVSSSLIDGGRLLSTLLSLMLPIAVLTNGCEVPEVCLSCCLLAVVTRFDNVW